MIVDTPAAPYWTYWNAQAVGAAAPEAEPILEPIIEYGTLKLVPNSMPPPDETIKITPQGVRGLWDDVYRYGTGIVHYFGRHGGSTSYVLSNQLDEAIDGAIGATVKSLSGFINQASQLAIDAQNWAGMELDALSANIGVIYSYFDRRIKVLEGFEHAALQWAFPSLQAQIEQLRHDVYQGFQFNSAVDRQWSVDHIFDPLSERITQTAHAIPVWSEGAYERAKDYTNHEVGNLGLHVLTQLVPLSVAVKALQTEAEDCVKPMCETLGPKTDLGKLLKGLKVATELAALTAILSMNEQQLAALINQVVGKLGVVVGDVEQFLQPGGETVAGLIKNATGDLI